MKILTRFSTLAITAIACALTAFAGPGSTNGVPPGPRTGDVGGGNGGGNRRGGPVGLPGFRVPKNAAVPESLQKLIDQYNAQRQAETDAQKALLAKLAGASEVEKQTIKDQLKANRDKFLEDTQQLRADIREQIKALRAALGDTPPVDGGDRGGKGKGRKGA